MTLVLFLKPIQQEVAVEAPVVRPRGSAGGGDDSSYPPIRRPNLEPIRLETQKPYLDIVKEISKVEEVKPPRKKKRKPITEPFVVIKKRPPVYYRKKESPRTPLVFDSYKIPKPSARDLKRKEESRQSIIFQQLKERAREEAEAKILEAKIASILVAERLEQERREQERRELDALNKELEKQEREAFRLALIQAQIEAEIQRQKEIDDDDEEVMLILSAM